MKRSLAAACALLVSSPLPAAAQEGECFDDSECPENFSCDQPPSGCPTPDCVPEPQPGTCEPASLPCVSDEDCPEATVCSDSVCVYDYQLCEVDDECGAGYLCAIVGSYSACEATVGSASTPASTGSANVGSEPEPEPLSTAPVPAQGGAGTDGAAGDRLAPAPADDTATAQDDPAGTEDVPEPEGGADPAAGATPVAVPVPPQSEGGPQPTCETVEISACIPAPVQCSSDADCQGGWVCHSIPDGGPPEWAGVMQACLPLGLAAVIDGHVQVNPDSLPEEVRSAQQEQDGTTAGTTTMNANGLGSSPGPTPPLTPGSGMLGGDPDTSPIEQGTQGGSEGAVASGCGVARGGSSRTGLALGVAALALFGLTRRRR